MAESKMTLQEVIPKVDESIMYLTTCADYSHLEAYTHFYWLVRYTNRFDTACDDVVGVRKHIGSSYVLEQLFPRIWERLSQYLNKSYGESQGFINLDNMLLLFGNVCDSSAEFGITLGKCGAIPHLFAALKVLLLQKPDVEENNENIISYIFGLLHNMIRLCPSNVEVFRDSNAIHILKEFLGLDITWQAFSLLVLAYVTEDSEKLELASTDVGVRVLLGLFKTAVGSSDHSASVESDWNFSAYELLDGINQLAINDKVKNVIREEDAIPYIIQMLGAEFSSDDQKVAAEALWSLAFIDPNSVKAAIPTLKKLSKSKDKGLRGACTSALFEIQGDVSKAEGSSNQSVQVMISYQWDVQQRAIAIRNGLVDAGCKVWMDLTNMKGDILESMSEAVQTSTVVLTCLTERYKNSKSCRSEATYAYKLDKKIIPLLLQEGYKPDGWLGLIQGTELYYSFCSDDEVENNMEKLLHAIMEASDTDEVDAPIQQSKQQVLGSARPSAADWTTEDVQQWLITNDLRELCEAFQRCGGKHLYEIYSRCRKNEEKIYDQLKSDYNLKLADSTVFVVALKEAFQE